MTTQPCDTKNRLLSTKLSILIFESHLQTNQTLSQQARDLGHMTDHAFSLEELEKKLLHNGFDIVLLDAKLSDETLKNALQSVKNSGLKSILLIDAVSLNRLKLSFIDGVLDYIILQEDMYRSLHTLEQTVRTVKHNSEHTVVFLQEKHLSSKTTQKILQSRDYSLLCISSYEALIQSFQKDHISLLLIDITDGQEKLLDMLSRLQTQIDIQQTPVLLLSSLNESPHIQSLIQHNVTDILQKPFFEEELITKVDELIRNTLF